MQLAYNGSTYHGWQIQPNATTVQETLQNALRVILKNNISVTGAGRTDTGVHASFYVAHFDIHKQLEDINSIIKKLNGYLPKSIVIHNIFEVEYNVNSRFSAISRTYKYLIHCNKMPFLNEYSYYLHKKPDIKKINEACSILYQYKDFTSFSKLHTNVKNNNCRIKYAKWENNDNQYIFTIKADRFLRNMVRAIVGTMIDLGLEKITTNDFKAIIESKNRSNAGYSVPGNALFLTDIEYPKNVNKKFIRNKINFSI